ncbi:hypothetical protein COB21_01960 [Candidatus Aerophobetes bacterium]|uniref:Uncharacterized protein n=1 Tax=Aerophobetes bacterium TaxID=2030807 RepID=A0A2A4X7C7_UNCAE|nr:MAG: hypothetical protein COB21_01960 [Candidatus Aerophobetes bacterium]
MVLGSITDILGMANAAVEIGDQLYGMCRMGETLSSKVLGYMSAPFMQKTLEQESTSETGTNRVIREEARQRVESKKMRLKTLSQTARNMAKNSGQMLQHIQKTSARIDVLEKLVTMQQAANPNESEHAPALQNELKQELQTRVEARNQLLGQYNANLVLVQVEIVQKEGKYQFEQINGSEPQIERTALRERAPVLGTGLGISGQSTHITEQACAQWHLERIKPEVFMHEQEIRILKKVIKQEQNPQELALLEREMLCWEGDLSILKTRLADYGAMVIHANASLPATARQKIREVDFSTLFTQDESPMTVLQASVKKTYYSVVATFFYYYGNESLKIKEGKE